MRKCPKCESTNIMTERRKNGDSECIDCKFKSKTGEFIIVNLDTVKESFTSFREEVIRKDKGYCELELSDGNNVFIEKRNGKYVINCTKSTFSLSKSEIDELSNMIKEIK